ncbi:hypothetical protein [Gluconobacter sp. GP1]|uniref:hypothetical protein n=1 Tax=Gluconobacter sp. GP1 TaxID=3046423 RepID=UPI00293E57D7|nr:hypothetical protein [Gluconobacter sp. GP1]
MLKLSRRSKILLGMGGAFAFLIAGAAYRISHDVPAYMKPGRYLVAGRCYDIPAGYVAMYSPWTGPEKRSTIMLLERLPDLRPDVWSLFHPENVNTEVDGGGFYRGDVSVTVNTNFDDNVSGQAAWDRWSVTHGIERQVENVGEYKVFLTSVGHFYVKKENGRLFVISCMDLDGPKTASCAARVPLDPADQGHYLYRDTLKVTFGTPQLQTVDQLVDRVRRQLASWQTCSVGKR